LRYEDSEPGKSPIPVTVAPPRQPPTDTHPALRRDRGIGEGGIGGIGGVGLGDKEADERKRDSGLAPTMSSKAREGSVNMDGKEEGVLGFKIDFGSSIPASPCEEKTSVPVTPNIKKSESVGSSSIGRWKKPASRKGSLPKTPPARMAEEEKFSPITTPIPTDSLLDKEFLEQLSFSKRGSVMLGGKKAVQARQNLGRR
jgi:hypothetical protein